ncbi:Uncharacterised protein [Vibrio cholerae]|nr:Uncharacterised protein [Vibrio cholerae]
MDKHHGFLGSHAFGKHGRHDVGFIFIGEGDKHIDLIDILFRQQLLVRGISTKDDGIFQLFR